ncbi:MAG: retropepsin-like aspartic protease [Rubrivivax sp.]
MRLLAAFCALLPAWAAAQSVSLAGQMGSKALLVIDGQTQTLAVGESARGVKLLKLHNGEAVVEAGGRQSTLRAGAGPARLAAGVGGAPAGGAREVVIPVGPGGHFVVGGAINGRPVQFMVDTGATYVSLGVADAERLGLDWKTGQRGMAQTANGPAAAYLLTVSSLRVGEVELANVGVVVVPAVMPGVLLGNSALSRFQMRRDADVMRLTAR